MHGLPFLQRFYELRLSSDGLRRPHLSLHDERYRRKTRQRAPKPPFGIRFYTGDRRGDVRNLHVFAVMQFTRFRPVRGVLRTASTDSCVLRQLRPNHWHFMNNQRSLLSEVGWFWLCVRLLGHPKTFPEGKVPTNVGGRGNAEGNGDRGTNQDGLKSCVFSSSVSTSAATFPMGEGLVRRILKVARLRLR